MAFAFPSATTVGQLYTYGATTWEWDGTVWNVQPSFGDVQLSISADNEIDTKTLDLILDSATGNTQVDDNLAVTGTLDVTGISTFTTDASVGGTFAVTGATALGNSLAVADATTLSGTVSSNNITPLADSTHDLGAVGNVWNNVYTNRAVLGDLTIDGTTNTISSATNAIIIDPSPTGDGGDVTIAGNILITGSTTSGPATLGNVTITGNLTVNGTTTTVNSTTVTLDDPVMTLGGDTVAASDDGLDRGIEFQWHDGAAAKVGFFGWDRSVQKFTFMPDATNTGEVFSGALGNVAFGGADFTGNVLPSADKTYDVGSAALMWNNGYFDTITVNNLSVPSVSFGDIQLGVTTSNTLDTTANDLVLSSFTGETQIDDNLTVTGNATVNGQLFVDTALWAGNVNPLAGTDTITVNGHVTPPGATFDLGAGGQTWRTVWAREGNFGNVQIGDGSGTGFEISTLTGSGANLVLSGDSGYVSVTSELTSNTISPNTDLTYDLGTATFRWSNLYTQTINMVDPATPAVNIPLTVQGNDLYVDGVKVGGACTVDTAAPASPDEGMFWLDRNSGILYVWVVDSGTGTGNWIQPL